MIAEPRQLPKRSLAGGTALHPRGGPCGLGYFVSRSTAGAGGWDAVERLARDQRGHPTPLSCDCDSGALRTRARGFSLTGEVERHITLVEAA
jgi:hypothetical protein